MPITIAGSGTITGISAGGLPDASITLDELASSVYSTFSAKNGTHTTGTITSGTTALTVASGSGISNGDYVVGEGITPGTTVSSGGGTTSITLSANANTTLSSDPVAFYSATKLLTPGLVGGQLCRAWVNFNGTATTAGTYIRASYNVSSITDNGVGEYTVNFTTAMPDANYSYQIGGRDQDNGMGVPTAQADPTRSVTTTALPVIYNYPPNNLFYDADTITVAIFR